MAIKEKQVLYIVDTLNGLAARHHIISALCLTPTLRSSEVIRM